MFKNQELMNKLREEYRYKVELHCHSNPASACSWLSPEELVEVYTSLGYDAIVLTNHLSSGCRAEGEGVEDAVHRYREDYLRACKAAEGSGLTVIYGMEIRFDEHMNDYLVYGADEEDTAEIFPYLSGTLREFREGYHNDDVIVVQAHPCREGLIVRERELLDGIEVFNLHPGHNGKVGLAAQRARENGGVITSGSDCHQRETGGLGGIYTRELPQDAQDIVRILRSGDYLLDVGGIPALPDFMRP